MMRSISIFLVLLRSTFSMYAQVPTPPSNPNSVKQTATGPMTWTKTNEYTITMRDAAGLPISNFMQLNPLRTDTISVIDKNTRNIYILPDYKSVATGTSGNLIQLARNVGDVYFISNEYSYSTYVNDVYQKGAISRLKKDYLYHIGDDQNYVFLDIYRYPGEGWAAGTAKKLPNAPDNGYWVRNTAKDEYILMVNGKTIDYSRAEPIADGDDMIVAMDGVEKYVLPGYYTMGSYIIKPVQLYNGKTSTTTSTANTKGCVQGDCEDGWGKYVYDNGSYDGFWKNGLKHGYGSYVWTDIGRYIGNWENDTMSGYGEYFGDNGNNQYGEFKNGKLNGLGYKLDNEVWSRGYFTNGELTNSYEFVSNNVTEGCVAGDCQNKFGKYEWANGDYFVGFFKNGNLYLGYYKFASGNSYNGYFNSQAKYDRTGIFTFEDGALYNGQWEDGKYNGRGYFHDADLNQKIGVWKDGELIKKMK